ncbi:imidazole glycerol phosphate synthase subunit HisH [Halobacteriales archaeon QS_1_67_19]|nr:MAG: imidazole glycerol phosphate synthase subunit HisH [Halobacteriales archaeon QS_1_67_19]
MNVTVIDCGVGNLRSLGRGLERADAEVRVTDDPDRIADAAALVLPGVGAFEECMRSSEPFYDVLRETATETPILGICVGLQLLFTQGIEGAPDGGSIEGLDLISGQVERLPTGEVKVPHVGWNELRVERDHPLVAGIDDGAYAYFVHSYCSTAEGATVAGCEYGPEFAAVAANEAGNVMGTQFHPEKSGATGLKILENFVEYARAYRQSRTAAD